MTGAPIPHTNDSSNPDRLDGWKHIAAHIGRGVRTAQRWERELGLPVRRLSTGAGDVVFALKSELDAWLLRQSGPALVPEPSDEVPTDDEDATSIQDAASNVRAEPDSRAGAAARRQVEVTSWLALVACVLAVVVVWRWFDPAGPTPPNGASREPASATYVGNTLSAYDEQRQVLWTHQFEVPFTDADGVPAPRRLTVRDVDGDGQAEVLLARMNAADARLYCFNRDGSLRYVHAEAKPVQFGKDTEQPYSGLPLSLTDVVVEDHPRFPGTVWLVGHNTLFYPAVLQRIDGTGAVQSEYWSNGYITKVVGMDLGGRPTTWVGAVSNETKGASLAVFFGEVTGSAPADSPVYRCTGCAPGAPDVFLLFPASRLQAELGIHGAIPSIVRTAENRFTVSVVVAGNPDEPNASVASAIYTLDNHFRIVGAELGSNFATIRRQFEAEKRVTPASRFRVPEDFYPVKRWNGKGFDLITGPEVPAADTTARTSK